MTLWALLGPDLHSSPGTQPGCQQPAGLPLMLPSSQKFTLQGMGCADPDPVRGSRSFGALLVPGVWGSVRSSLSSLSSTILCTPAVPKTAAFLSDFCRQNSIKGLLGLLLGKQPHSCPTELGFSRNFSSRLTSLKHLQGDFFLSLC